MFLAKGITPWRWTNIQIEWGEFIYHVGDHDPDVWFVLDEDVYLDGSGGKLAKTPGTG